MLILDLQRKRILVVEDNYFLAQQICGQIRKHNGEVLGPAPSLEDGKTLLRLGPVPDGCILDIRLGKQMIYPLAQMLQNLGIPFIFASSERPDSVPDAFRGIALFSKPIEMVRAAAALFPPSTPMARALHSLE